MQKHFHPHMPHIHRHHVVKMFITMGCVVGSTLCLVIPGYEVHAAMIATTTNVIWVWS